MKKQVVFNCPNCGKTVIKYLTDTDPHYGCDQPVLTNLLAHEHDLVCSHAKRIGYVVWKLTYWQATQLKYLVGRMDKSVEVVDEIADIVEDVMETNQL